MFHAKDEVEMNDWINAIQTCISSLMTTTSPLSTVSSTQIPSIALTSPPNVLGTSSSSTNSPQHQPMISSTSGVEIGQTSTTTETKSRTLPMRSHSSVEGQLPSSSTQQAPVTSKKKSGGFFSMKRK